MTCSFDRYLSQHVCYKSNTENGPEDSKICYGGKLDFFLTAIELIVIVAEAAFYRIHNLFSDDTLFHKSVERNFDRKGDATCPLAPNPREEQQGYSSDGNGAWD